MNTLNILLLIVLPYLALLVFLFGSIYRYRNNGFKVTSISSQFLEGKKLFWGSIPFHYGIGITFLGHLLAFLFPSGIIAWNGEPWRLLLLEFTGFAFGLSAVVGMVGLIFRRLTNSRIRVVTSKMDGVVLSLLLVQLVLGVLVAYYQRWGSSWFAATLTPYLWSIFKLNPQISAVSAMPWLIKSHIIGAYLIILLIPFSRLMHILVLPLGYLWRPFQVVIWYWNRSRIRNPKAPLQKVPPKNN